MKPSEGPISPRMGVADLRGFEARHMQTLQGHTRLSQEAIRGASKIIQCAMESGQVRARVQTIHLAHQQFCYSNIMSTDTHPLYDMYTLSPLANTEKRICFSSVIREFVEWLKSQGLDFRCTTCTYPNSEGVPVPFVHLEVIFVPETPARVGRAIDIWNTKYMQKCLDTSSIPAWSQRCADALRRGASHFVVCTLYRSSDFFPPSEGAGIACMQRIRHYLTMMPVSSLMDDEQLVLNNKFTVMVQWVREIGYVWTLLMPDLQTSEWAYFTVLLDPLEKYA